MFKELSPANSTVGGLFYPLRHCHGWRSLAGHDPVEVGVRLHSDLPLEGSDGGGKSVSDVHAGSMHPAGIRCKGKPSSLEVDTEIMDRWPARVTFKAHVERVRTERRITLKGVAEGLGISRSYLTKLLYTEITRPELDLVEQMSKFFEAPISDFAVDAVAYPAGVEGTLSVATTTKGQFVAGLMVKGMTAADLTDDDIDELYEDFQRGLSRIRKRKT